MKTNYHVIAKMYDGREVTYDIIASSKQEAEKYVMDKEDVIEVIEIYN